MRLEPSNKSKVGKVGKVGKVQNISAPGFSRQLDANQRKALPDSSVGRACANYVKGHRFNPCLGTRLCLVAQW